MPNKLETNLKIAQQYADQIATHYGIGDLYAIPVKPSAKVFFSVKDRGTFLLTIDSVTKADRRCASDAFAVSENAYFYGLFYVVDKDNKEMKSTYKSPYNGYTPEIVRFFNNDSPLFDVSSDVDSLVKTSKARERKVDTEPTETEQGEE